MIIIENLVKEYLVNGESFKALDNINLQINDGEFVIIIGHSGSGKTTLLNIIEGLDNQYQGKYWLNNIDVKSLNENDLAELRRNEVGIIFQKDNLLDFLTVRENVYLPLYYKSRKYRKKEIDEVLKQVNMEKWKNAYPKQLSGGMSQRVAIARLLISNTNIILADEPTGNLDYKNSIEVLEILKKLNKMGKTIILVTHDQSLLKYASKIIRLENGHVID